MQQPAGTRLLRKDSTHLYQKRPERFFIFKRDLGEKSIITKGM